MDKLNMGAASNEVAGEVVELAELDLAIIGGGIGDVVCH
jgi:hypothetical protein